MDIKTLLLFHIHLQTYEYKMEFEEAYDYVIRVFDKLGIEQVKDINQKKTIISENGFQVIDEKIPGNILIYKCYYWLEYGPFSFIYEENY